MSPRPLTTLLWVLSFAGASLQGSEILTLQNGFSIEAKSHRILQNTLIVATGSGTLEFPSSELAGVQMVPEAEVTARLTAKQNQVTSLNDIVGLAAASAGLTPELIRSVAMVESNLQADSISPKGARGLMQLMPGTAAELGIVGSDMRQNVEGGARYLRQLLLKYKGDAALALAAYNAGPGSVARFGGVPPYTETRRYVVKVLHELAREQKQSR